MIVIAKFYVTDSDVPSQEMYIDWDSKQSVANFAKEANLWLRRHRGYRVVTTAH